jgi:hypothetical protein
MPLSTPLPVRRALELAERERKFLLAEMSQVKGLMPVLMKRRNKQRWSEEDLAEIRTQVRRISRLSPYLVIVVMPGGFAVLPVLAWWLDRRRNRRGLSAPA